MTKEQSIRAKLWMARELARNAGDYLDCGEVLATTLAEACERALDLYSPRDHSLLSEDLQDLARDVADTYERTH